MALPSGAHLAGEAPLSRKSVSENGRVNLIFDPFRRESSSEFRHQFVADRQRSHEASRLSIGRGPRPPRTTSVAPTGIADDGDTTTILKSSAGIPITSATTVAMMAMARTVTLSTRLPPSWIAELALLCRAWPAVCKRSVHVALKRGSCSAIPADAHGKEKGGRLPASLLVSIYQYLLAQPPRCVCEHRVDLAGVRGQVGLRHDVVAVAARNVLEQLLEILAIAVDGLTEFGVVLVLAADVVESLLTLQRVETTGEDVALAAAIA